jgi:hypothetical protein
VDSFSVAGQETSPQGIAFNTDGTKMFIVGILEMTLTSMRYLQDLMSQPLRY